LVLENDNYFRPYYNLGRGCGRERGKRGRRGSVGEGGRGRGKNLFV